MQMKRTILLTVMLLGALTLSAQYRNVSDKVNHFLTLSLGAGGTGTMSSLTADAPLFRDMPGADALFAFTYEIRKNHFIFGFGAQVGYDYTWQRADSFLQSFDRLDREGEAIRYDYAYSDYRDEQSVPNVSVPIYVGGNIGDHLYILAGAKVSYPLFASHRTTTLLATQGTYSRFVHTIRNAPSYGYYYQDKYTFKASYASPLTVSPMLEVGARIPVESRSRRVGMRLGLYAEYAIPITAAMISPSDYLSGQALVDYSAVDQNPATMNQDNLRQNIVFNAIPSCAYQQHAVSQLTVGLKWTVLFNVTKPDRICMCETDF